MTVFSMEELASIGLDAVKRVYGSMIPPTPDGFDPEKFRIAIKGEWYLSPDGRACQVTSAKSATPVLVLKPRPKRRIVTFKEIIPNRPPLEGEWYFDNSGNAVSLRAESTADFSFDEDIACERFEHTEDAEACD